MHLCRWLRGGIFLRRCKVFEFLISYSRDLFLTFIFSSFFQFPCKLLLFYVPSLLCRYFDSSEKTVDLNLRGSFSIACCLYFSDLGARWLGTLRLCYFSSSSRTCIAFYVFRRKEQRRISFLSSFSLRWKQTNKNEGLQLEDRHLNLNIRLMEKEFPSISFCF